jgi:TRAP-type C4-dicarboxylate transport system substrate-binding protein
MADKLVTIAEYTDSMRAEMARQVLEDFGIRAVVLDQNATNLCLPPAILTAKLQVFESQAEQARQILEENQQGYEPEEYEVMDESDDDEPYEPDEEEF